jgi:hypothetical protein
MLDLETAAEGRVAQLRRLGATVRQERSARAVDGRLSRPTRLRLRVGRLLVELGTGLLAGYPRRTAAVPNGARGART